MNQNSQNIERNENKILFYDIKKVNENMDNDCKIEEENQTSKEKDIQIKPIGYDNNINSHIDNNKIIAYEKMNNYYNIQDKNQELKERSNVAQSEDTNNNINNCDNYINCNNYENTERKKVKIKENDRNTPQHKKEDKYCCCCQCCCECISSCGRCLVEFCSCNCCSEYCYDCSECFSICGECLCKCFLNSFSHCEIF